MLPVMRKFYAVLIEDSVVGEGLRRMLLFFGVVGALGLLTAIASKEYADRLAQHEPLNVPNPADPKSVGGSWLNRLIHAIRQCPPTECESVTTPGYEWDGVVEPETNE